MHKVFGKQVRWHFLMASLQVFKPSAERYVNQEISKTYEVNKREKKKLYNKRILQIEHRSFMPLVMSATGGMGGEYNKFYALLAEMISYKRGTGYNVIASRVRRKITFLLIKLTGISLQKSCSVFYNDALEKSLNGDAYTSEFISNT